MGPFSKIEKKWKSLHPNVHTIYSWLVIRDRSSLSWQRGRGKDWLVVQSIIWATDMLGQSGYTWLVYHSSCLQIGIHTMLKDADTHSVVAAPGKQAPDLSVLGTKQAPIKHWQCCSASGKCVGHEVEFCRLQNVLCACASWHEFLAFSKCGETRGIHVQRCIRWFRPKICQEAS